MRAFVPILQIAIVLVALLGLEGAHARQRYALTIGSNDGDSGEQSLRFAERDAQRMADVLTRLGGFPAENVLTLLSPSAEDVTRALASLKARGAAGAMVVVYYSGHSDERALHLSGARFRFDRLKAEVRALGAELAVFLVDSCRSGGIVRVKGATPTSPFVFDVKDEIEVAGTVIITSSAENEDAQESERLEGGVFTHHLVTGLLGAADRSGDDTVTLSEVYRYVYAQTIAATSTTSIVQHPTFSFDVQGHNEIVLTRLDEATRQGRLKLVEAGHYLVFDRNGGGDIVAELDAEPNTTLWFKPGTFLVRRREPAAAYEKVVQIKLDAPTLIGADALERVPFRHAVRKGSYGLARPSLSLGLFVDGTAPLLNEAGVLIAGALGLQVDFADLALQARVRYGRSWNSNDYVAMSLQLVGVDAALFHLFDVGDHGVGFGVRAGMDWLRQRFETAGVAPDVDQLVARFGPMVRVEIALGASFTLSADIGVDVYLINAHRKGGTSLAANAAAAANFGVSGVLP